jgi:hypothetical protein
MIRLLSAGKNPPANRKDSTFTLTYDRDKVADNALELNYWNLNRVINVSSLSPPA